MHDQRKVREAEIDEKTKAFTAEKITRFCSLYETCFAMRDSGKKERDCFKALDAILEVNPELYTMHNYRRAIFLHLWGSAASADDAAVMKASDLDSELELNTRVITKDYKVYAAWLHRKWILAQMSTQRRLEVLLGEAKKCEGLLKVDERNFHVWGYRRWVMDQLRLLGQESRDAELSFTEKKIASNFSNYSAWHNRALMLGEAMNDLGNDAGVKFVRDFLEKEIPMVVRAFYCDPADQSAWLYALYLLTTAKQLVEVQPAFASQREQHVREVLEACTVLLADDETPQKWPKRMQYELIRSHADTKEVSALVNSVSASALLTELSQVDMQRRGFYASMMSQTSA